MMNNIMPKDVALLKRAMQSWESLEMLRCRRRRLKDFAYGRQWNDMMRDAHGRMISEEQHLIESGRMPITNNLIRQLLKSIIGRYRYMVGHRQGEDVGGVLAHQDGKEDDAIVSREDIDARALEEFLISGCVVQRLGDEHGCDRAVENVSLERIFVDSLEETQCRGRRFVGMLHDVPLSEIFRRFGDGSVEVYNALRQLYAGKAGCVVPLGVESVALQFSEPMRAGCCRVIEVWEYLHGEVLRCHDRNSADYYVERYEEEAMDRLAKINESRRNEGKPRVDYYLDITEGWRCTWMSPTGEVLSRYWVGANCSHPFVMKFYPLIDGEVHSLVEDVVDQQKYVNRLISLLDNVIASSAKGVLLYPADQLPEGFTWRDMRRIWSNPNGVLPFKRTSKHIMPQQVHSSGATSGASDMLRLQLQLFDEISGTTGALRGKTTNATGAEMLHTELENGTISLLDILASFKAFVNQRDLKLRRKQAYDNQ